MVLSRLVLLVLVVSCPFDPVRAAEPPERLRDRAESLISGYGSGRNAAERDSIRTSLVEIASELEQAGESVLAARAHERAGNLLAFQSGDLVGAQERWAIGLDVARASGDPATEASLLNSRAIGVSAGGGLERGARLFEELVELRRSMGDVRGEGVTLTNLARARLQLFRLPEADAALRRAMACHREVGNIGGLAHTFQQRGQILLELGDVDGAIAIADSAIALALRSDDERVLGAGYADRGWFRQQAGDPATAIADLDRGLSILRELD